MPSFAGQMLPPVCSRVGASDPETSAGRILLQDVADVERPIVLSRSRVLAVERVCQQCPGISLACISALTCSACRREHELKGFVLTKAH